MRSWFLLLLSVLCLAATPQAMAQSRAFVAIETADIEASQNWYANVFDMQLANSFSRPTFEQRILQGGGLIVELIQHTPARTRGPEGLGLIKAGLIIDDLDARQARWQSQGVTMLGRRIHDAALGLDTIILEDPDGNMIQIFGRPAG